MKAVVRIGIGAAMLALAGAGGAQVPAGMGSEEFGMTPKQLVEAIEKVEGLVSKCMREQGFQYTAADYNTVRRGMNADKKMPGMSDKEFIAKHGFGYSTTYTGEAPQLASGYSPAREGLGKRNVEVFKALSPADQVAYNRALFGENVGASFADGLEKEDFSLSGGCTKTAIAQSFKADEMKATYYNPKDALMNKDPRMKAAIRKFSEGMRKAGFDYNHPDEVEFDVRKRLAALTGGGTIPVEKMTPSQRTALKELQGYERRVAVKHFQLAEDLIAPVEDKLVEEMFGRKPQ